MRDLAEILADIIRTGDVAQAACAAEVINTYVACRRQLQGTGDLTADDVLRIAAAIELNLKTKAEAAAAPQPQTEPAPESTVDLEGLARAIEQVPEQARPPAPRLRVVKPPPAPTTAKWRELADLPAATSTRQ